MRILVEYLFFHLLDRIARHFEILRRGQVAEAIFSIFYLRDPTVSIFEIMQCNKVRRPTDFDVILDGNVIVEFVLLLQDEPSFPFYIQVAAFSKCSCNDSRLTKNLSARLQAENFIVKFYVVDLC